MVRFCPATFSRLSFDSPLPNQSLLSLHRFVHASPSLPEQIISTPLLLGLSAAPAPIDAIFIANPSRSRPFPLEKDRGSRSPRDPIFTSIWMRQRNSVIAKRMLVDFIRRAPRPDCSRSVASSSKMQDKEERCSNLVRQPPGIRAVLCLALPIFPTTTHASKFKIRGITSACFITAHSYATSDADEPCRAFCENYRQQLPLRAFHQRSDAFGMLLIPLDTAFIALPSACQ